MKVYPSVYVGILEYHIFCRENKLISNITYKLLQDAGRRYMCIIRSLHSLTQSTDNTFQTKAVMTSLFLKTNLIVIFWINHFSLLFLLTAFFFIELILLAAADFYNVSVLWIIKVVTIFLISS